MSNLNSIKVVIDRLVEKLIVEYAPLKIILFGSFADGSARSDSDLDLLIVKETSERFIDRWSTVQRILTGLHRGIPIETFVLTPQEIEARIERGDQFLLEVLEKGEVLYAAEGVALPF